MLKQAGDEVTSILLRKSVTALPGGAVRFDKIYEMVNLSGAAFTMNLSTLDFTNAQKGASFTVFNHNAATNPLASVPGVNLIKQWGVYQLNQSNIIQFLYMGFDGANHKIEIVVSTDYNIQGVLGTNPQGGNATVEERLNYLGGQNYSFIDFISGTAYDNTKGSGGNSTTTPGQNLLVLTPYMFDGDSNLSINTIGIPTNAPGAVGTGNARIGIYDTYSNGKPNILLSQVEVTGLNSASGYKSTALAYTFQRGKKYWLATHYDSDAVVRTVSAQNAIGFGAQSSSGTGYFMRLQRIVTYASGLPAAWAWSDSERNAGTQPVVRFLVA